MSAVEQGTVEASIETLERIARALDGELVVDLRMPLAIGRGDQRDAAHAACSSAIRRALERRGIVCVTEHGFVDGRLRGWVDLLGFDPSSGRVIVVEVKTELRDLGGLERQVDWYARSAPTIGRSLGWRAREVRCLVAFLATEANDAALEAHRAAIEDAFPLRGQALRAALDARAPFAGWGLTMVDPQRRGELIWVSLRLDGRRRPAPYRSYADFMRTVRATTRMPGGRRASRAGVVRPPERPPSGEPQVRETT